MLPNKFNCQALIIFIVCTQAWITAQYRCGINLTELIKLDKSDIGVVKVDYKLREYLYPRYVDRPDNAAAYSTESISIFCPGKTNADSSKGIGGPGLVAYNGQPLAQSKVPYVTCVHNQGFISDGKPVDILKFSCPDYYPYGAILRNHTINNNKNVIQGQWYLEIGSTEADCAGNRYLEIGYEVNEDQFLTTIELCHDEKTAHTLWAYSRVQSVFNVNQRSKDEVRNFRPGMLFQGLDVKNNYNLEEVYPDIFDKLKNRATNPSQKILVAGQLISRDDKQYQSDRDSTMFYANTLPMWQSIYNGNWYALEKFVRKLAFDKGHHLDVWAGGLGVLKLEGKEIYLHGSKVPVLKVLFKIVIDRFDKSANVFVIVNNPYATSKELGHYQVCKKFHVCEEDFSQWNDPSLGYLYCCKLSDFYENNQDLAIPFFKQFLDSIALANHRPILHYGLPFSSFHRKLKY